MTRIFHFALALEPFELEPDWSKDPKGVGFPKNPNYLAQVCSRWRQITLASPSLWNHINIAFHNSRYKGHLPRALSYTKRSSQLPLHPHISEPYGIERCNLLTLEFITTMASRTSSLEYHSGGTKCLAVVLRGLWSGLASGALTKLVTNSTSGHLNSFLLTPETWTDLDEHGLPNMSVFLDIRERELGAIPAQLTVPHLRAVFPRWGSLAYHNLVNLRLTSAFPYSWCSIKEVDLIPILKASPALRILHFAISIADRNPEVEPVLLGDLEVVTIKTVFTNAKTLEVGSILRLLGSGTQPLRLTIENAIYEEGPSMDETMFFFERSNITRFCAKEGYPPIKYLLPRAPNLQSLVFSSCKPVSRESFDLPDEPDEMKSRLSTLTGFS